MDFFEALKERAIDKASLGEGWTLEFDAGVARTIEALKEMAVGEPIATARLCHVDSAVYGEYTVVEVHDRVGFEIYFDDHWGTDGEGVVVMVFRVGKP